MRALPGEPMLSPGLARLPLIAKPCVAAWRAVRVV
jgi:hypothetical protein